MIPAGDHIASQRGLEPIWVGSIPEPRRILGALVFDPFNGKVFRCDSVDPLVLNDASITTVIKIFEGYGPPGGIPEAVEGDYYLELVSGDLYKFIMF